MPWEVNWSKRLMGGTRGLLVWARCLTSSQARARVWHWTTYQTIKKAGIEWIPVKPRPGRYIASNGYVIRSKGSMTKKQITLADKYNLWLGVKRGKKNGVKEHQLVVAEKYGSLPSKFLVRHLNGVKDDNRPENLLLGTHKDNSRDHRTAVAEMMYWRERALLAEGKCVPQELDSN